MDAADTGIGYLSNFDSAWRYELHGRLAQKTMIFKGRGSFGILSFLIYMYIFLFIS